MDGAIFNDLEWLSEVSATATPRQLNFLYLNIYRISAMLTRKLLGVIDNIIVDVFKIICCSEPTDSFMITSL